MPIQTVDASVSGHVIAYACVCGENESIHKVALDAIKKAVEDRVELYVDAEVEFV